MNYNKLIYKLSKKYKNHPLKIFHDRDIVFTYEDIRKSSLRISNYLMNNGISKGDRVALWMGNVPEFVSIFAACLRIGAVIVPISTHETAENVAENIKLCACSVVFCDKGNKYVARIFSDLSQINKNVFLEMKIIDVNNFRKISCIGDEFAPSEEECVEPQTDISLDETIIILNTSGSTGKKKGIEKSIKSYFGKKGLTNIHSFLIKFLNFFIPIRMYNATPWSHNTGITILLLSLLGGVLCEIVMENFNPTYASEIIKKRNVFFWLGTATMLYRCLLIEGMEKQFLPKIIFSAGEEIKRHTIDKLEEHKGGEILVSFYGSTEVSHLALFVYRFDKLSLKFKFVIGIAKKLRYLNKVYSKSDFEKESGSILGEIYDKIDVIIYDEQLQKEVEVGEICVHTQSTMNGYYGSDDKSVYLEYNGKTYIKTGDVGYKKENTLYLCGRKKNLIIKSGENILPSQIEKAAYEYNGVSSAIAFGIPSKAYGEEICLAVEKGESAFDLEEFKDFLFQRLPKHLMPREFIIYSHFPQNNSGKIDLNEIKQEALKEFSE